MNAGLRNWQRKEESKETYLIEIKEYHELCKRTKVEGQEKGRDIISKIKNEAEVWSYIKQGKAARSKNSSKITNTEWENDFK